VCLDYHEHAIGSGADAALRAYLELRIGDAMTLFGVGIDANIVLASLKAIVSGVRRAVRRGVPCIESDDAGLTSEGYAARTIMSDKLIIFDTTLRDGEQSPGASMTREEKLRIARQLERLRVDVIEAGFAASSNGDFEAVKSIAGHVKESIVCSLARANDRDISRAAEALKGAARSRIHTFIATSPLHMEKKLRMTPEPGARAGAPGGALCPHAHRRLSSSRRGRVPLGPGLPLPCAGDRSCREGATTINIPDTVGYAIPELYGNFIRQLRERVPNSDRAVWSVHCHNDLGMAVANSLAGVKLAVPDRSNARSTGSASARATARSRKW
jgi:hypothetical protein